MKLGYLEIPDLMELSKEQEKWDRSKYKTFFDYLLDQSGVVLAQIEEYCIYYY